VATKSTKSAGSQFTNRGVTQGTTLVGQKSGLPIDELVDTTGVRRLAVDANISAQDIQVSVDLSPTEDGVFIGDPNNGNTLEIESDGSINTNVEIDAQGGDNIAIHDSQGDELAINPDGSINVNVSTSAPGTPRNVYNEISAVPSGILTTITTYTVPLATSAMLDFVESSGTNIAEFSVEINSSVQAKKRTYYGSNLNTNFLFNKLTLSAGDVVISRVRHLRPNLGDFESRIVVVEV